MKTMAGIFAITLAPLLISIGHGQAPITNLVTPLLPVVIPATSNAAPNHPVQSTPVTNGDEILPLVEFQDMPIQRAVAHLARQAGINYLIAPELEQKWTDSAEPVVNLKLTNVLAKDLLQRMLNLRNVAVVDDPVSGIAFIIPASEITNPLFAGGAGETNSFPAGTMVIPLIQFADVPITMAIENLARQADIKYMIDPRLERLWDRSSPDHVPEPILNLRLENVTALGTLNRLLNIRGLVLIDDPVTHVGRITFGDEPWLKMNASQLDLAIGSSDLGTNEVIPLIQFSDVPLDTVLEHFFRQAGLRAKIDLELDGQPMPISSLHWENLTIRQAILALCENHDLVIIRDEASGILQVKPREAKKHHHLFH